MGNQFNFWVEDFFRLDCHLPFFFCKAIIHKNINMRNGVKRDLFGEQLRPDLIIHENALGLIEQLIHCRATCT